MQRVIVTVKREDEARVRDLEVPADLHAEQLARLIAEALRWQKNSAGGTLSYRIEAQPLGRTIQPDETLAGAGVWDGSWLVLHPVESAAAVPVNVPRPVPSDTAKPPHAPRQESGPASIPIPTPAPNPPAVAWSKPLVPEGMASPPNIPITSDKPAVQLVPVQSSPPTVTGWRSLGLDLPPAQPAPQSQPQPQPQAPQPQPQVTQPQAAPTEKKSSSFVWKQLDE